MQTTKLIADKNRHAEAIQLIKDIEQFLHHQDSIHALDYILWKKKKAELKFTPVSREIMILNNQIYWAHLGVSIGSEQCLDCPVLIVRTTKNSTTCTIIPLSLE